MSLRFVLILSVRIVFSVIFYTGVNSYYTDGTTNFIHGFPYSCVSIGLIYQRRPVLGVIFNPLLDQLVGFFKTSSGF